MLIQTCTPMQVSTAKSAGQTCTAVHPLYLYRELVPLSYTIRGLSLRSGEYEAGEEKQSGAGQDRSEPGSTEIVIERRGLNWIVPPAPSY